MIPFYLACFTFSTCYSHGSDFKKVPPLPALMAGTLLGGVFALIFQRGIVLEIGSIDGNNSIEGIKNFFGSLFPHADGTYFCIV